MRFLHVTYIVTSLLLLYGIAVQKTFAEPATPNPGIVFPSLLIQEVDFKNSSHDSVTLYIADDGNKGNGSNIKGLSFKDDSSFFTIDEDIYIRSDEKIKITFKNEEDEIQNSAEGIIIQLSKSGLTGTTEQFIVLDSQNSVLDAVCWTSDSPTEIEINELEDLFNSGGWASSEISSCFNSENIAANQPIQRKDSQDTNSKDDWMAFVDEIIEEETDEPEIIETEEEETDKEEDKNICKKDIYINEFMPNPKGKDTGNEWIELINSSGAECSLNGWEIDDQEGGSKAYVINSNDLLPPDGFALLPSWQTKINLNNDEDYVRLFNPKGDLIDEIQYEDSPEQESFGFNSEEYDFLWSTYPTPLLGNIFPEPEEPKSSKDSDEEKKSEEKSTIQNGTLSDEVFITEVFPNPEGQDSGKEWIELYNNSSEDVMLGNWKLSSGTKEYIFENIKLESQSFITLSDKDIGFSIKNSDGEISLKDFKENIISTVTYEKSIEGNSFMQVTIIKDEEDQKSWIWSQNPTPGEDNQKLYKYKGIVEELNPTTGELKLMLNKNQPDEETLNIQMLITGDKLTESLFQSGTLMEVILKQENNTWTLYDYSIISAAEENPNESKDNNSSSILYIALSSLPPLGFLGYSAARKFGLIKIV